MSEILRNHRFDYLTVTCIHIVWYLAYVLSHHIYICWEIPILELSKC